MEKEKKYKKIAELLLYDEIYKNINKRQQNDLDLKDFFEKYI